MTNPQLYINYRLINNLLSKSIRQEFGSHITINLNPLKYMLNRTHYSFWVEGTEIVTLDLRQPVSLKELNDQLNEAVANEDYELAAKLRDEISKRPK